MEREEMEKEKARKAILPNGRIFDLNVGLVTGADNYKVTCRFIDGMEKEVPIPRRIYYPRGPDISSPII